MWEEEWSKLSEKEKEQFADIINILLSSNYIVREIIEPHDKVTVINKQYRFIERNYPLLRDYLEIMGWIIQIDQSYGVAVASIKKGTKMVRLDKLTTYLLYTLRLIYEEGREKISLRKDVLIIIGEIIEKMILLSLIDKKPPDKSLQEALVTLKEYNIIDKVEGDWTEPETQLIIYPSILFLVSGEKIQQLYKMVQNESDKDYVATTQNTIPLDLVAPTKEREEDANS